MWLLTSIKSSDKTLKFYLRGRCATAENTTVELFGDYHLDTMIIRVWTRTAVRKRTTTFGTFLSTLCHEFCHHLDGRKLGFRRSPHTRGFYQRAALLYHHARATPVKSLPWIRVPGNRWRINWQRMRAVSATRQLPQAALRGARMSGEVRAPDEALDEALRGPLDKALHKALDGPLQGVWSAIDRATDDGPVPAYGIKESRARSSDG